MNERPMHTSEDPGPAGQRPDDLQNLLTRRLGGALLASGDTRSMLAAALAALKDVTGCDLLGIVAEEKEEGVLLIELAAPVTPTELHDFESRLLHAHQRASGRSLDRSRLRQERNGFATEDGLGGERTTLAEFPIAIADTVIGMIAIAGCRETLPDANRLAAVRHVAGLLAVALQAAANLRDLAAHDPLTGAYNRRHLENELQRAWQFSSRYKTAMAVMMMDIDLFKDINDQWGHRAGDVLLKDVVNTLRAGIRATDTLARFGGDEFVIILPQANEAEALVLARRLLEAIRGRSFAIGPSTVSVTMSIGIAVHDPLQPLPDWEELLHRADQALFRSKKFGRNNALVWRAGAMEPAEPDATPTTAADSKGRILALDDEEYILMVLRRLLENQGYTVDCAQTLSEAREQLKKSRAAYDLLLCDLWLPDGDGLDLLRLAHELDPSIVSLVITGQATTDNAINALRQGAYDFIQKPVIPDTLLAAVDRALRFRKLTMENKRYRDYLEDMVRAKHSEVTQALDEIKKAYEFSLETMVAMLDAREFETGRHSVRVRDLTLVLARRMGLQGAELEEIGRGALLHDIGKIGIPDSILLKPGKLTEDEWMIMRKHPEIGYRFLKNSAFLETAAGIVLSHHERWDGEGYPHRLRGEAINLGARIFAVIDAYDAMRSPRVYKHAVTTEAAVAEVLAESGRQFDPNVVSAFQQCIQELEQTGRWSATASISPAG